MIEGDFTALSKLFAGSTSDMTEGNPYRHILAFAMPVFISQVFQQLYNTADSLIVGHFLGTDALAAVSSSGNLIYLLVSFFEGLAMGAGIVISRYFGAGDKDRVSKAVHTDIVFGIICGVFLTVVGVVFTPLFLKWMKTDKDILPQAIEYFRYYFYGALALVLYNISRGIMSAVGDSKRPLFYLIFSSLLNIALDIVFVGGFGLGVWSAAFATVLSEVASVVLCFAYLLKPGKIFSLEIKKLRIHKDMLWETLRYGVPSGVQNSVIGFANVIVQTEINSFGKFATTAYGAYSKIEGFGFLPITSFSMAISTFISQNLGAKKHDRAKKGARFGILAGVIMAEIIGALIYFFIPQLTALFDNTKEVIRLASMHAHTTGLFYFLLAYSHSVAAVCRGAGKAFVPMTVMLSVWCVFRITYILTVMKLFGKIELIYWAYPITWSISSVIYFIYYRCSDWVHGFDKVKS